MVRHRYRVLLPECDLFCFTVGSALLQSSLFLFNQINQSQHESNFAIYRVTWGEEFFKAEWW
jgi:hypothetical protein